MRVTMGLASHDDREPAARTKWEEQVLHERSVRRFVKRFWERVSIGYMRQFRRRRNPVRTPAITCHGDSIG